MKKTSQRTISLIAFFAVPLLAVAGTGFSGVNTSYLNQYKEGAIWVVNYLLVPVLMAVAFIVFLWGIYKYFIYGAANESEKSEGRKFAMWGIIGFVILLSLWGLVNLIRGTLGLNAGQAPAYPTIGGSSNTSGSYNDMYDAAM